VRMKGEIEEHIKDLGFEHTIIVRPGLIIGHREESRTVEGIAQGMASIMGKLYRPLKESWAQDADVIARAAIAAAVKAEKGEVTEKVWVLDQKDILRLGAK